jgi:hypothetical protein
MHRWRRNDITAVTTQIDALGKARAASDQACPYRKSNPYVLMVQPTKDRPHFDAPSALNGPLNRRILA